MVTIGASLVSSNSGGLLTPGCSELSLEKSSSYTDSISVGKCFSEGSMIPYFSLYRNFLIVFRKPKQQNVQVRTATTHAAQRPEIPKRLSISVIFKLILF